MGSVRTVGFYAAAVAGIVAAGIIGFLLVGPILTGTTGQTATPELRQPSSTVTDVARLLTEQPPSTTPSPVPERTPTTLPAPKASDTPTSSPSPTLGLTSTPIATATSAQTATPTQVAETSTPEATATETVRAAAQIMVNPSSLLMSEDEGPATFTITLSTEPQSAVTVPLSASDGACSVSTELVTLDVDNWSSGVTVVVTASDDQVASGDRACLIESGSANSDDADYAGLQSDDVSVTVIDDDEARIEVAPTSLSVSEPEGAASFTITLSSQPLAEVVIALSTSNEQCQLSSEAVTLDSTNWLTGSTVTVVANDDLVTDGEQTCLVLTGAATSEGADYSGVESADVAVTVGDDDEAGIVVAPTSLSVSEREGAASFTITLSSQPLAEVMIPLSTSNEQCQLSSGSVTLDSTNWLTGAIVTVEVSDDQVASGDRACLIETGSANSDDADFSGLQPDDVSITVIDDDEAGIVVAPKSLSVREPEGAASFTIALSSQPLAEVVIPLSTSNGQCLLSSGSVTLDSTNWLDGVTVTVEAGDDLVADGEQTCLVLTGVATSEGADYGGREPAGVTVTVGDDDEAGILVTPVSLSVSEPGDSATITISLTSQPRAVVTLQFSTSNDQCSVSPSTVTLDGDNWRDGARVTTAAVDDWKADGDKNCRVRNDATSSDDAAYDGLLAEKVKVTVADDDVAGILVSPASLSLRESAGTASLNIGLSSRPLSPVSISLSPSSDGFSLSPDTVSLDGSNWRVGSTVTVAIPDDHVAAGQRTVRIKLAARSGDANYDGVQVPDVTAVIDDDDVVGVRISPTDLILAEGKGSVSYQVVLDSRPTSKVTIRVISDGSSVVSPDVLTFGARRWNEPQTVTVTAPDSEDDVTLLTSTITHTVGSDDDSYSKLSVSDVVVRWTVAESEGEAGAADRILNVEEGELSEVDEEASGSGLRLDQIGLRAIPVIVAFLLLIGFWWLIENVLRRWFP